MMKKTIFAATCVALTAFTANAYADEDAAITTGVGGAVTGAFIGGPVGAAVGGVLGFTAGAAINPPPREVVTYVEEQPVPETQVVVKQRVRVGTPLPEAVVIERVPNNDRYAYAFVNNQRVIVEPRSRRVVRIIE
jgi:uncharacterized protein DUF1236